MAEALTYARLSTKPYENEWSTRGRAVVARRAHNPEVVGSNPTPATKTNKWGASSLPIQFLGITWNLFVEPLARLPGIEVSLQRSVQFIGYLSFADSATLCTPEKRAAA